MQIVRQFVGPTVLLLASWASARAQLPPCYAGFEISQACITERSLDQKVAVYQRKMTEAVKRLGASYRIILRLVNNTLGAGYNAEADGGGYTAGMRTDYM